MRVVGVKELKTRLSAYLREVRRGETFLVTDRDVVVAELRPARAGVVPEGDELDRSINALADAGEVAVARRSLEGWSWRPGGARLPEGTATRLLDWLRADRDAHEER